jgi:hypothetical protein
MKKHWEYLAANMGGMYEVQRTQVMNSLAKEGWELVCAGGPFTYLRRERPPEEDENPDERET